MKTELTISRGCRLSILGGLALFLVSSAGLGWPHAQPATPDGRGRRAAYARYFAGPGRQVHTLVPTATINLPQITNGFRDFVVNSGHLFALQAPPSRRLIALDLGRGRGDDQIATTPLDLIDPSAIVMGLSGVAWVYDFRTGDFVQQSRKAGDLRGANVKLQPALFQPTWLGSQIVANGLFSHELLRLFTPSGKPNGTLGQSPFPNVIPDIAMHLNRNSMASDPQQMRVALAFLYVPRLEIMSADGQDHALSGPTELKLAYRTMHDPVEGIERFIRTDETRFAYVDVTADANHVYALFSGRSRGDWKDAAILGDTVDVWTWAGDYVGEWRLPSAASAIAADGQGHKLYAAIPEPAPTLLEFDASTLTRSNR